MAIDESGGRGRSDEDRARDREARDRARAADGRQPPSFGPSTRAGRERGGAPTPPPAPRYAPPDPARPGAARPRAAPPPTAGPRPPSPAPAPRPPAIAAAAPTARPESPPVNASAPPTGDERFDLEFAPARPRGQGRQRDTRSFRGRDTRLSDHRAARPSRGRSARAPWRVAAAALATAAAVFGGLAALGAGTGGAPSASPISPDRPFTSAYGTPTSAALPPATRIVGYAGAPQAKVFGILGTMPFAQAAGRLRRQAAPYGRKSRPVLRAYDLIATIANAHPGPAAKYRTRQSGKVIARYLRAARRAGGVLILDIQPGTSNFVDETRALVRWLREPDVQLALDPEWRMRPGVAPGSEIGWVSGGEVGATLALVAKVVRDHHLPPKMVLVHRFTDGMIRDLPSVTVPKGIVPVISVDGVGNRASKVATYARIAPSLPKPWLPGFKLFYVEDKAAGGLMSGQQVMALKPRPHVVLYE